MQEEKKYSQTDNNKKFRRSSVKIKLTIPPFSPLSMKIKTISTPKIEFKNELMSPITTKNRETYKKNYKIQEKPENCSVKYKIF